MCGLKERTIQRKLLAVVDLTLQTALEKACAAELTEKETTALHGGSVQQTKKVAVTFPECFRCGKVNYSSDTCFFRNSKCHGCQKVIHIVKKFPEKTRKKQRPWKVGRKVDAKVEIGKKEETAKGSFGRGRSGTQAISERKPLAHVYSLGFPWKM